MKLNFSFDAHCKKVAQRLRETCDDLTATTAAHLTRSSIKTLIEYKVLETPWANGDLISIDTSHHEGSTSIEWFMEQDVDSPMSAFIGTDGAFPRVDLKGEQAFNRVHSMGCSFGFDLEEMASYEMQGLGGGNISVRKGKAARRFHDRNLNAAIMSGVAAKSITGILNLPGALQLIAGTATGTTAAWNTAASPNEITDTFEAVYSAIDNASNTLIKPNTCVLPSNVATRLRRQNSLANGDSIMKWLKDTFPEITLWFIDPRMNTAGLSGTAAMLLYNRDSEYISALMPMVLKPLPIFIKHQKTEQAFLSRYAGIMCPYPTSVAVLSGI